MLNVLRDSFKTRPYLKFVLALVALAMVAYLADAFDISGRQSAEWAARVNGKDIPAQQFLIALRNKTDQYRQMLGENFNQLTSRDQLANQTLEELIDFEIVIQDAKRLGLTAPRSAVAKEILSMPELQDASGVFIGKQRYTDLIESQLGSVEDFESNMAKSVLYDQWTNLLTEPIGVSEDEVLELFRRRTERPAVDFFVVPVELEKVATPTDGQLREWYDGHVEDYRRDEGRRVRMVTIEREAQRAAVSIDDEKIKAHYDANQSDYTHTEQRRASHILFRIASAASDADKAAARSKAEQAHGRALAGEDFATLATELSDDTLSAQKGGDLDFFERGKMVGPFEQAAFGTAVGELAAVTESPFGFHVIKVTDERPEGVDPLDNVREPIRALLENREVQELTESTAERLVAEITAADKFAEVAQREGLTIDSRVISKGERLPELGASPDFVPSVMQIAPGGPAVTLRVRSGMAVLVSDEIVESAIAPMDEVLDRVTSDLKAEVARETALSSAQSAVARTGSMADAAKRFELAVQTSGELAPGQPLFAAGGAPPELKENLFGDSAVEGARGTFKVPAGALAYEITKRQAFDQVQFELERDKLVDDASAQKRMEYRRSVVEGLKRQQRVERNHALMARVAGRS